MFLDVTTRVSTITANGKSGDRRRPLQLTFSQPVLLFL
jgi:hypothetical protein